MSANLQSDHFSGSNPYTSSSSDIQQLKSDHEKLLDTISSYQQFYEDMVAHSSLFDHEDFQCIQTCILKKQSQLKELKSVIESKESDYLSFIQQLENNITQRATIIERYNHILVQDPDVLQKFVTKQAALLHDLDSAKHPK